MDLTELTEAVEQVSRGYAERFGIDRTADWFLLKLHEELGELTQLHLARQGQARPRAGAPESLDDAFAGEVADVLGQLLVLARHHDIDLEQAVRRKWLVWLDGAPGRTPDRAPDGAPAR
jgi:NTP pyrophosphatase (non-canonical NTP hydrolase)